MELEEDQDTQAEVDHKEVEEEEDNALVLLPLLDVQLDHQVLQVNQEKMELLEKLDKTVKLVKLVLPLIHHLLLKTV